MAASRSMESRTGRTNQREYMTSTPTKSEDCGCTRARRFLCPLPLPWFNCAYADIFSSAGYGESGERLVAGVVPLNEGRTHVLLIQSNRRSEWVLPKGGWESDESCTEAAQREAWEEAGIVCTVDYDLGQIKETRAPKQISKNAPKALYQFYQVTVTREESEWPEKHKRNRQWATYAEAKEALKARPELLEALERCTICR
jgi:diphosphoinositol-polyphosphate diphosphatase